MEISKEINDTIGVNSHGSWESRVSIFLGAFLAAVVTLVDAIRSLLLVGYRYLDEDVAIYWYAAQEFAHLQFREPFFYGQAYNHLFESLIAAPLVAIGVSPWIAVVSVSMAVGLVPWAILAWLAGRTGVGWLAILFLGAPALMPAGYQILLTRFFGMGLLLASIALLVALVCRSTSRWAAVGFLLGFGSLIVNNTVLLALPCLAWLSVTKHRGGTRPWVLLSAGVVAAAGIYGLGLVFYLLHPGWVVHASPSLEIDLSLVGNGLSHLPRHLGRVTPSLLMHPGIMLAAIVVLTVVAAKRRIWPVFLPALSILFAVPALLAFTKAYDATPSVFYAYERYFLGFPLAVGLVVLAGADVGQMHRGSSPRAVLLCAVIVIILATPKQLTLPTEALRERHVPQDILMQADLGKMLEKCSRIATAARAVGTDFVLSPVDRMTAYACGAMSYGSLTTLYPQYERRTWILLDEISRSRDSVLIVDVEPEVACEHVSRVVEGAYCRPVGEDTIFVRYGPGSVLDLAKSLGLVVRPF